MNNDFLNQVWPEWRIEGNALGKGSFGVVYKGIRRDHNVESYAAIKVISIPADPSEVDSLRSEGMDADSARTYFQGIVKDFVSEIQLMESLKGLQNIVSIEDYKVIEKGDEIGWNICIRMELLTPFNTYIRDKKLTEQEVIRLGCDICTALEICNKRNIIHRDVKPENIFINDFGSYKLGDFGIARKLENMTGGLSHKGAYNYMAPEVIYSTKYDARVDIYSLGIVLYRLLNGNRLPFLDSDQQLMNPSERRNAVERRLRGEQLPAPCDASPAMADVILRACAFEPDARFATAEEMKQALQRVANGRYETNGTNEEEEDKSGRTVTVRESITEGDGSMYIHKTPPANRTPLGEINVETPPPLGDNKKKRAIITAIVAVVMVILAIVLLETQIIPMTRYNDAVALMEQGNYEEAAEFFQALGDYRDSAAKASECTTLQNEETAYQNAIAQMSEGDYQEASRAFKALGNYKDSATKATECTNLQSKETKYQNAIAQMIKGDYEEASKEFQALGDYRDSATKATECATLQSKETSYQNAIAQMNKGNYQEASKAFKALGDYRDSATKASECATLQSKETSYQSAIAQMNKGNYQEASKAFKALGDYRDSAIKASECATLQSKETSYQNALAQMNKGSYQEASKAFKALGDYRDSATKASECATLQSKETAYQSANALQKRGELAKAAIAFGKLGDYKDAKTRSFALWDKVAQRDTISVSRYHTVGLKSDGTVMAVGSNEYGQCNVSGWEDIVAISAGYSHTVGLKSDGTVVAVGYNSLGQCNVSRWEDIVAISAGNYHTVGLKSDGTLVGVNIGGEISGWKDIVAISSGSKYTVGLKLDGTVVGINDYGQYDVSGWKDIVAIAAGDRHTVGLKSDGTVVAVGSNWSNACDVSGWKNIVAISAGFEYTVGLKPDGTVVAVGAVGVGSTRERGVVPSWKDIVAISVGYAHIVVLKSDGTVVAVDNNDDGQCNVSTWKNIKLPQ